MILAYKKTLGKFTKVLGFEKTPPLWEKFPKNPVFIFGERPQVIQINNILLQQHSWERDHDEAMPRKKPPVKPPAR